MKKIETKTAKNGAKLYYVDGKRVARAKAIEIAENNARERISSLFDNNVDEVQAQVVVIAKVKDEFDNRVEERFFFDSAEAGIAAAEKIAAEFGRKAIIGVDDLLTKKAIATSNRWGEIRISESYKAAQTFAREKLAQAFDEECDRAQAQEKNVADEELDALLRDYVDESWGLYVFNGDLEEYRGRVDEDFVPFEFDGVIFASEFGMVFYYDESADFYRKDPQAFKTLAEIEAEIRKVQARRNDPDLGNPGGGDRPCKNAKADNTPETPTAQSNVDNGHKAFIQRAEKIIEDCYNTKGWGNPVYHWYNPVEDDGSNDDDDEPSAFNLLPAVDSLRDVDDEGGNDSGADTEPAQETTIDAAQAKFLVTPYGILPRVDREDLAAVIEKFSDSSKPSEPVEFIRRVLYTIDKPVDVDALAAMEHIENGFEDLRNFIRFVGRKEGLTVAQCEAIYAELYCDCNKADTVYDDAFYARRDMLIDKFKAQNAAQVADKRKAQKTAPLAGRAPAVINAEFDEIVEEWIREDRAEKNTVDKIKISTRALRKYLRKSKVELSPKPLAASPRRITEGGGAAEENPVR